MRRLYRAARSAGKAKAKGKQSNPPASMDFATETVGSGGCGRFWERSEMRSESYPNKSAAAPRAGQKQASSAHGGFRDGNGEMRGTYGGYGGDENVDVKATTYILWVRERLKMERSMAD
ncbi:hypothetical protein SDJN03_12435, partial [Cucurbita argyrosperma subsp. sororia]